jgi:hypothetical protein
VWEQPRLHRYSVYDDGDPLERAPDDDSEGQPDRVASYRCINCGYALAEYSSPIEGQRVAWEFTRNHVVAEPVAKGQPQAQRRRLAT